MKTSKKKQAYQDMIDDRQFYSIGEALEIFSKSKSKNFDESIDIAINLGIDAGKSDENVRGSVALPNSLGKDIKLAVFTDSSNEKEAKDNGADFVGLEELAEEFKKDNIKVDLVIASQSAMKIVGQLGQILGPKGLMPSPKNGTVTDNIGQAVKEAKSGKVLFKNDKGGIIHGCIAKVSFDENQVSENLNVLIDEVKRLKPASTKGVYIKDIFISSTMGPGLKLNSGDYI